MESITGGAWVCSGVGLMLCEVTQGSDCVSASVSAIITRPSIVQWWRGLLVPWSLMGDLMFDLAIFHRLHEMRSVFGRHQSVNLFMITVFFVTSAGGFDAEGAAVAVKVEFDLLDVRGLLIADVIGSCPFLHGL